MSLKKFCSFWVWAATEHIKGPLLEDQIIDISTRNKFQKSWNALKKKKHKGY